MLPEFDDNGNLPPGIHRCSLEEIIAKFGQGSPEREIETRELVKFIEWARQLKIKRVLVDGSYSTIKVEPVDVDIVILAGEDYPEKAGSIKTLVGQWPFLHVVVAEDEADLRQWTDKDFGTDRSGNSRGILEVIL